MLQLTELDVMFPGDVDDTVLHQDRTTPSTPKRQRTMVTEGTRNHPLRVGEQV